ncbi:MAG TPA: hypothetical protein VM848_19845 [Acidimicrobiia bacterium]|nr:hypothetical protein [Acidimicrobiia bacterium]
MTAVRSVGTCFGFEFISAEPVWLLREGDGTPLEISYDPVTDLVTGSLLAEWTPNERNPIEARLFQGETEGTFALSIAGGGWYLIDPAGGRITTPVSVSSLRGSIRLLGLPLLLCCLARGDTTLHSAAVQVGDKAILLAAPGRHGKTSLGASFAAQGHRLLSEDLSCLTTTSSGVRLIPGPTGLRIRPDMTDLLPLPGYEEIGRYEDRVVLRPVSGAGDCTPVEVGAIVFLSDFGSELDLVRLVPGEAMRDLWFLSFHLPNDEDRQRKFQALVDLAGAIPAWRFVRPLDPSRLKDDADFLIEKTLA